MRAITHDTYGGPQSLTLDDIETPQAGDDEVLVRVEAASLNPFDWHLYRGDPYLIRPGKGWSKPKLKQTVGADLAGEVVQVGANVTSLKPGDLVAGSIGHGALAEFAVASPANLTLKPATLSFEHAAALPMAGITAIQTLRDVASLKPGQSVLVNGASGGVGHLAIQLARSLGASRVAGVCSQSNAAMVRALGADAITYETQNFTRLDQRFDVVLDMIGNHPFRDIRRVLEPTGILAIVGAVGGGKLLGPAGYMLRSAIAGAFAQQSVKPALDVRITEADLTEIFRLADAAELTPTIARVFPLSSAVEALTLLEQGHVAGKLVVTPRD